jgi:hypothetical protein
MPGTTPVYGFPYPEPTDLVADYPALGQDLAEDVETVISGLGSGLNLKAPSSIANSGGSASLTGAMVSFSGVTTVSLNGVFSSTYDNYRIIIGNTASASANLLMRLRASGSDNSSANYAWSGTYTSSTSAAYNGETGAGATSMAIGYSESGMQCNTILDIFSPFATNQAIYFANNLRISGSVSNENKRSGGMTVTTSYDGFTLFAASGTITGSIRVYGYKNS